MNARQGGGGKGPDKDDGLPDSPIPSQQPLAEETLVATLPQETRDLKPMIVTTGESPPIDQIPDTVRFVIPKRLFKYVKYSPDMEDEHYQLKEYIDGREEGSAVPKVLDTYTVTLHPKKFLIGKKNPNAYFGDWVRDNKQFLGDWYIERYPEQLIRKSHGKRPFEKQYVAKPGPNERYGFSKRKPPVIDLTGDVTRGDGGGPANPRSIRPLAKKRRGNNGSGPAGPDDGAGPAGGAGHANPQPLRPPDNGADPAEDAADGVDNESELIALLSPGAKEGFAMGRPAGNNGSGPAGPDGTGANSKSINFTRPGWNRF